MTINQDKLRVSEHLVEKLVDDFKHVVDYPKTERSRKAASSFRASAPMTLMAGDGGKLDRNLVWQ